MCFVVQNHLGKGAAARPRCIPQAMALSGHLTRSRAIRPYRRSTTRGRLRSPCTHRLEGVPAPKTPDHFMETRKGAVALPFLGTIPSSRSLRAPCIPEHLRAAIGCSRPVWIFRDYPTFESCSLWINLLFFNEKWESVVMNMIKNKSADSVVGEKECDIADSTSLT